MGRQHNDELDEVDPFAYLAKSDGDEDETKADVVSDEDVLDEEESEPAVDEEELDDIPQY